MRSIFYIFLIFFIPCTLCISYVKETGFTPELIPPGYTMVWKHPTDPYESFASDQSHICDVWVDEIDNFFVKYRIRKSRYDSPSSKYKFFNASELMQQEDPSEWYHLYQFSYDRISPLPVICFQYNRLIVILIRKYGGSSMIFIREESWVELEHEKPVHRTLHVFEFEMNYEIVSKDIITDNIVVYNEGKFYLLRAHVFIDYIKNKRFYSKNHEKVDLQFSPTIVTNLTDLEDIQIVNNRIYVVYETSVYEMYNNSLYFLSTVLDDDYRKFWYHLYPLKQHMKKPFDSLSLNPEMFNCKDSDEAMRKANEKIAFSNTLMNFVVVVVIITILILLLYVYVYVS